MDTQRTALLTPDDVARLLQVSKATVGRWIRAGLLPSLKLGTLRRVTPEAVRQLIERGDVPSRGHE